MQQDSNKAPPAQTAEQVLAALYRRYPLFWIDEELFQALQLSRSWERFVEPAACREKLSLGSDFMAPVNLLLWRTVLVRTHRNHVSGRGGRK